MANSVRDQKVMTKKFLTFGILLVVVLGIIFVPTHTAHAAFWNISENVPKALFTAISQFLVSFPSVILLVCGWLFDKVILFSIVNMAKNLGPDGIGGAITSAWATLRDVANMCFIFVLLYAAFKTMFDTNFSNFGKTVKDIIIIALLINFSLFFSKVVIDASNIVAIGFYNSISSNTNKAFETTSEDRSISSGYMNMLRLQTLLDPKLLEGDGMTSGKMITIAFMTAILMLVVSVVFLVAAVMFITRFIILVFLMIISPLAFIAYIIPGLEDNFTKWRKALVDQSFFAPIYFAFTWVVFKLGEPIGKALNTKDVPFADIASETPALAVKTIDLFVNYLLMMGFAIAALVIAKMIATRGAMGGAFKTISGGVGGAAFGGAAFAGRNTVGRASGLISEKQREKWSKSTLGRAGLWVADKGKKGSFDVRGIDTLKKVPGLGGELGILGKAGGKGGFAAAIDEKVKKKAAYAKDVYGQTDKEKEDLETAKKGEEKGIREKRFDTAVKTKEEAEASEKKRKDYMNNKLKPNTDNYEKIKKEKEEKERELDEAKKSGDATRIDTAKKEVDSVTARLTSERELREEARKEIEENDSNYRELKKIADQKEKERVEAERINKKKEIDDEEYSEKVQTLKNAGKERQKAYADRLEQGTIATIGQNIGSTAGWALGKTKAGQKIGATSERGASIGRAVGKSAAWGLGGNKAKARAVRDIAEEKEKKDRKKLFKDLQNELGIEGEVDNKKILENIKESFEKIKPKYSETKLNFGDNKKDGGKGSGSATVSAS